MVYKFTETKDVTIVTSLKGIHFDSEWLLIKPNGLVTIKGSNKGGYSWDGCSPKVKLFGRIIGTPDGGSLGDYPITYYASMLHDILYQYKKVLPFSRLEVDQEFKTQLEKVNFKFTSVYYFFVRKFGGMYGKWLIK